MTNYTDLSEGEQKKVLETIQEGFDYPNNADVIVDVVSGHACAHCFMAYYNCLCSHDAE